MPVAEKTYSFKAPEDLGERLRSACRMLVDLCHEREGTDDLIARSVAPHLLAEAENLEAAGENQSAVMRGLLLLVIEAVETAAAERMYSAEFAAMARERDPEHDEYVRGALASAAALWHDDE